MINNGVVGDGSWEVDVLGGGETRTAFLNPTGPIGTTEIVFDYFHYVQVGTEASTRLSTFATSGPTTNGPNSMISSGSFAGENGLINWQAVSSIAPGSSVYETELQFTSDAAFGAVRLHQYLDEDVLGVSDDVLVQLGTPGTGNFQLLTIDDDQNVGVSHAATYNTAVGMTYEGWAADQFASLRSRIQAGSQTYSVAGNVTGLPPYVDSRFPTAPAWGPRDITSSIAFQLDPTATFASTILTLGGAPDGIPPQPPEQPDVVPEPSSVFAFVGMMLCAGGSVLRRRKGVHA